MPQVYAIEIADGNSSAAKLGRKIVEGSDQLHAELWSGMGGEAKGRRSRSRKITSSGDSSSGRSSRNLSGECYLPAALEGLVAQRTKGVRQVLDQVAGNERNLPDLRHRQVPSEAVEVSSELGRVEGWKMLAD